MNCKFCLKYLTFFLNMCGLLLISSLPAQTQGLPFANMPLKVQDNLYYFVTVNSYKVQKLSNQKDLQKVKIKLQLMSDQASVMTDRPYRETTQTSIENFIAYIQKKNKANLNLTLMVHDKEHSLHPLSFEQTKVVYNSAEHLIEFEGVLVDSRGSRIWTKQKDQLTMSGKNTTLMAEG